MSALQSIAALANAVPNYARALTLVGRAVYQVHAHSTWTRAHARLTPPQEHHSAPVEIDHEGSTKDVAAERLRLHTLLRRDAYVQRLASETDAATGRQRVLTDSQRAEMLDQFQERAILDRINTLRLRTQREEPTAYDPSRIGQLETFAARVLAIHHEMPAVTPTEDHQAERHHREREAGTIEIIGAQCYDPKKPANDAVWYTLPPYRADAALDMGSSVEQGQQHEREASQRRYRKITRAQLWTLNSANQGWRYVARLPDTARVADWAAKHPGVTPRNLSIAQAQRWRSYSRMAKRQTEILRSKDQRREQQRIDGRARLATLKNHRFNHCLAMHQLAIEIC